MCAAPGSGIDVALVRHWLQALNQKTDVRRFYTIQRTQQNALESQGAVLWVQDRRDSISTRSGTAGNSTSFSAERHL